MAYFTIYDTFICILSLITYVADVITDLLLIIFFYIEGHAIWGSMSLCFVAVATLFMQIFSFHWHVTDRTLTWKEFIIHILFLAPLHRYVSVLKLGRKSRQTGQPDDLDAAYRELNDISILRLFETFLESAPQLLLQLYIIMSNVTTVDPLVGISCVFSLLSVAWAVTAYTDALHLAYKKLYKRSAISLITHTLWQTGMITSRVCAIVLFATVFKGLVAIPLGLHAVAMVLWIAILKPEFGSNSCEKALFTVVAAIVHTFCFLNLKDGKSRWRMLFYYTLCLIENTVLVALWYSLKNTNQPSWINPVGFVAVFGGFLMGVISMFLYYCCCHPSGPTPLTENQKPTFQRSQSFNQKTTTANNKQPIFNVSSSSAAMINHWLHASLDLTKEGLVQNPDNYLDTDLHTSPEGQGDYKPSGYHGNNQMDVNAAGSHGSLLKGGKSNKDTSRNEDRTWNRTLNHTDYTSHNDSKTEQEQFSLPSYNLIEMFSRCKQDPGFSSTLSLNRSGDKSFVYDSNYHSRTYREPSHNMSREQEKSYLSTKQLSRRSGNGDRSMLYDNTSPVIPGSMDFSPIQISPLDPYKLLEASQSRTVGHVSGGVDVYGTGSDGAINTNTMESTPVLSIQPDTARGITRLSLSYSALNPDDSEYQVPSFKKCYEYSSEDSSMLLSRLKGISPSYSTNKALRKTEELSFSNMSLPLPDNSMKARKQRPQQMIDQYPSHESLHSFKHDSKARQASKRISPLSCIIKNRSMDSFYTNSPIDKQLSYLSDQGMSSSDHVLSLSDTTTNPSHRSLTTSSGFQSEESNFSSPLNGHGYSTNSQFQSTPILENEISSIQDLPSSVRVQRPRESLDKDVYKPPTPPEENTTPVLVYEQKSSFKDKRRPFPTALMYSDSLEEIESPSLPPLTVSSRRSSSTGSGNSGRFFRDLTDPGDNSSQNEGISDSSGAFSQSVEFSKKIRNSVNNEQSSLSACLSDRSSSITGNQHSSDETISISSDPDKMKLEVRMPCMTVKGTKRSPERKKSDPAMKLYENFPYNNEDRKLNTTDENSHGQKCARFPCSNDKQSSRLVDKLLEESEKKPGFSKYQSLRPGYEDDCADQNAALVEDFNGSPYGLERNDDLFSRDKWRASLDKEMRKRLVDDIEKLAPKKLYQLRAKNDTNSKKKLSPVKITDYNESPYKFRQSNRRESDYVNINNVSPDSLSSAYEHVHVLTPGVYSDYENVYNLNSLKIGNCPILRPESLSDSVILDEHVNPRNCYSLDTIVSEPCSSYITTVRSPLSLESSGGNSPINITGINSAFKPVKPRRSVEIDDSHTSNSSDLSVNTSTSNKSSSDTSGTAFEESTTSNNSCLNGPMPDESPLFVSKPLPQSTTFTVNKSQVSVSEDSSVDSMSDYKTQSIDMTGQVPVNYLKLAGTAPLSFSMSSYPLGDRSSRCSSHSYSNSIPWEDSENNGSSFQDRSGSVRQPLRSLENTPVFSPIYGFNAGGDLEISNRKRFMSTPKLSTGSDGKTEGKTPTGQKMNPLTPRRHYSLGVNNKTFSDDTSTWSSHSVTGQEWALEPNERSSLSKTTYI